MSVIGGKNIYQVDLEQTPHSTVVKVTFPNLDNLISLNRADSVHVKAAMSYQGAELRTVEATKKLSDLSASNNAFDLDVKDYGKFVVSVEFLKGSQVVSTGDAQTIGIVADEYNIAPISASLPVAFFSLQLWGDNNIRYDDSGNVVPTIMLMERPSAYDWNALPEGVYSLPYLTKEQVAYQPSDFTDASNLFRQQSSVMADYVRDLYDLNPDAKFNLYCVDFYVGLIQTILYANNIPQDHYTITVLSDGSFSYSKFNSTYNTDDPQATHDALKSAWTAAREHAYANGQVDSGFSLNGPNNMLYAAVDSEPNAQWWLARPALLESAKDNNSFGQTAQQDNQVVRIYIDQQLSALQKSGEKAINEFKALYNFNDSYFTEAEKAGKEVMMFLGSTVGSEAGSFPYYARFAMAFYGDDYAYYYKGHPSTPTDLNPSKKEELDALGITDVDSTIAAELILFFYPDIFMSGYSSSTYESVSDPERAKGLFARTKAAALADTSQDYSIMDWFMSPIDDNTPQNIKNLATNSTTFLVEFSDDYLKNVDYDIALWDDFAREIRYYKLEGSNYVLVSSTSGSGSGAGKVATISSKLDPSKVLDIAAGSTADHGNVQIYQANSSLAQNFRITPVDGTYYIIENAGSGKALDVEGYGKSNGTNVQQYKTSANEAQLWEIIPTGDDDGSVYFKSKCNGLYLDVKSAKSNNGTNIQVYEGNGTDAQKFIVNELKPTVENGTYEIQSDLNTEKVLDVNAASKADSANVQIYQSNATDAQKFSVAWNSQLGCYSITNLGSGKALDVAGGKSGSGTNVQQYAQNGTKAQFWRIVSSGNDAYKIVSATGDGCCLDVNGAKSADKTNVQIYRDNGTQAQKWHLQATN